MSLSKAQGQFGAHSVTFYTRSTGTPICTLKVIKEAGLDFAAEYEDLTGGSQVFAFDSEIKSINSEIKLTVAEYQPDALALLLGGALTENSAEASGAIDGFANVNGTTVKDAANGIDDIELTTGGAANLKEGKYVLVATGAAAVSLYGLTDVDFKRGTDLTFDDDCLIESGISVASGDVEIEELGITLSKVGTPAFTTGHTAEFYIRKPNTSSIELVIGQDGAEFSEVGCLIAGQRKSDGTITYIELYRCKGAGMPISFSQGSWSEASITMKALYDSSKDAVAKLYRTIAA